MRVLVVNAGSSSLKLRLVDDAGGLFETADLPADAGGFDPAGLAEALADGPAPAAVGHRVGHGGTDYTHAVRIDAAVRDRLDELTDLAPLHQPKSLAGLDTVTAALPDVPAVACFDTAFHTTIPDAAATYAVPREWRERYGVRRYGFHGLSHAYASRRAIEIAGGGRRVVTCHLGAGASLCAVLDGHSVDTTMGFTPLEGLVMATRSGNVDPGLVLWLQGNERLPSHEVAAALEHRSGLLALAGTPDMREVESRARAGRADAALALDVYSHPARRQHRRDGRCTRRDRRAGLHRRRRRALGPRTAGGRPATRVVGSRSRTRRTTPPPATPTSPDTARRSGASWSPPVRTCRSPRR